MVDPAPASPGARLPGFWIPAADFYAITDLDTVKRLGGILWLFSTALTLILFPLAHPTLHGGNAGWAMAAGFTVAGIASGALLLRAPDRFTPDALMAMSYVAVAEIALFQWLGGRHSPYAELLLIWALYTTAAHPPRRVAMYLGVVVAVVLAPLAYEGWNSSVAAAAGVRIPLLLALSSTAMIFTATVRSKRLALHQQSDEASRLARTDSLTALGNRRAFDEVLERATAGSRSSDRPLSVLLADLEGFKAINDRHGHLEGDRCLREVASALRAAVRTPDSSFRWGGDEFALLLTGTDTDGARAVGERLRRTVADTVKLPGGEPLGLGWGVAELSDGLDAADLVAAADKALLAAKACEERTATA